MKKTRWTQFKTFDFINNLFDNEASKQQVRLIQAYQNCFQDEYGNLSNDGELVIKDLLERGFVKKSTAMLTDNRMIDHHATLIAEGKRSLVLEILEMIEFNLLESINLQENEYE